MNAVATGSPFARSEVKPVTLPRGVVPGLLLVVAAFDVCFWNGRWFPGLSLAVFFTVLTLAIWCNRRSVVGDRRSLVLLLLLAGTLVETVIETGCCNILMLLGLTAVFSAETCFVGRAAGFDRWMAQVRACLFAPVRLVQVGLAMLNEGLLRAGVSRRVSGFVVIVGPTAALLVLFGSLLSSGNAVFSLWMSDAFQWLWKILPDLEIDRLLLWLVVAIAAVALLWPSVAANRAWNWPALFQRWPETLPAPLAFASSAMLLGALNALFAVANAADITFLWHGGTLPAGVSFSRFVHQGVEMLIATVVLSALVLATIFNQPIGVSGRRGLKIFGALWIAQNLFLIVSTARRLQLYIEAYDASVERISTLIFLMLVATGFGLLAVMIGREKPLAWLVGRTAVAALATLYLTQFLNLAGWVADYNVGRWERDQTRELDVCYLNQLGPAAWPAIERAEKLSPILSVVGLASKGGCKLDISTSERSVPQTRLDATHWREFSLRAWWNRAALRQEAANNK